jgi:predicted nucleic acid-binding protein
MKRHLLDTNVLVRLLIQDIPSQGQRSIELFKRASAGEIEVELTTYVALEVIYVLSEFYKIDRRGIASFLASTVTAPGVVCEPALKHPEFFNRYVNANLSAVDTLLWCSAEASGASIATFDQKLLNRSGSKPI